MVSLEAQAVYGTVAPAGRRDLAAMVAAAAAGALFVTRRVLPEDAALQQLAGGLLGWTATLMFMFQPLAQLVWRLSPVQSFASNGQRNVSITYLNYIFVLLDLCSNSSIPAWNAPKCDSKLSSSVWAAVDLSK